MFEALANTLASAFSIWDHKEKTKYIDTLMGLKKDYYEEYNKDSAHRSDAVLDRLEFELRVLSAAFTNSVSSSVNTGNK
jgi:hypothetical protein